MKPWWDEAGVSTGTICTLSQVNMDLIKIFQGSQLPGCVFLKAHQSKNGFKQLVTDLREIESVF